MHFSSAILVLKWLVWLCWIRHTIGDGNDVSHTWCECVCGSSGQYSGKCPASGCVESLSLSHLMKGVHEMLYAASVSLRCSVPSC